MLHLSPTISFHWIIQKIVTDVFFNLLCTIHHKEQGDAVHL